MAQSPVLKNKSLGIIPGGFASQMEARMEQGVKHAEMES